MAAFAYCLSAVGAGLSFFPIYYAIRFFRRRRRQSRSFLQVIGKASEAPIDSDRPLTEHPLLLTPSTEPSLNQPRGAEAEPLQPTQSSGARAA
jgi:hypothetical protein